MKHRIEAGAPTEEELRNMKDFVAEFDRYGIRAAMIVVRGAVYSFTKVGGEFRVARQALP